MSTKSILNLLRSANRLKDHEMDQLADFARVIEARRSGIYMTSPAEKLAINEALEQHRLGISVSKVVLQEADKRFGV